MNAAVTPHQPRPEHPLVVQFRAAIAKEMTDLRDAVAIIAKDAADPLDRLSLLEARDEQRWAIRNLSSLLVVDLAELTYEPTYSDPERHGTPAERLTAVGQLGLLYHDAAGELQEIVHEWRRTLRDARVALQRAAEELAAEQRAAEQRAAEIGEGAEDIRTALAHDLQRMGLLPCCPDCGAGIPTDVPLAGGGVIRRAVKHCDGCTWRDDDGAQA